MANYGNPTWLDKLSPAIADQIVTGIPGLTKDRVFSSAYDERDHLEFPPADRFITLFFPDLPPDQAAVSGGGIWTTPLDSILEVTTYIRLESDIENRSTRAYEETAFGAYELIKQVLSILQTWPGPVDTGGQGQQQFRRPMRLRGLRLNKRSGASRTRWVVAPSHWEVSFVADLGRDYTGVIS